MAYRGKGKNTGPLAHTGISHNGCVAQQLDIVSQLHPGSNIAEWTNFNAGTQFGTIVYH